jgi:penicillin-binding protein 1A
VTRFILGFVGSIFTLVTMGLLMSALAIGAIFWMYGRDLPSHESLAQYTPPTISRIYSAEGRMIDEFAEERRLFAPVEDIPDLVKDAFISAEDKNFWTHKGYDPRGMIAAAVDAAQGGRLRGASTITQQVMKNFLLSSDRSAERKVKELILASRLESTLSKPKILELYMNEIFLGQNSFGVAAAAQTYFNKTLGQLSAAEAAMLASLPQAPGTYHPVRAKDRLTQRRNFVLKEMYENGYITKETLEASIAEPLRTVQNGDYEPFRAQLPPRDYFTDEIRRQLSRDFGEAEFFGGGLAIRATMDPDLQQEAAKALREGLEKFDRNLGVWRGTSKVVAPEALADEESWRAALAEVKVARDIAGWFPAVVLSTEGSSAVIGIEGLEETGEIPGEDVTWARKRQADGKLGPKARRAGDLVSVGDVVLVRRLTKDADGAFIRWTLRQVPEVQGGFMAMDVNTGRVLSMQGGFS